MQSAHQTWCERLYVPATDHERATCGPLAAATVHVWRTRSIWLDRQSACPSGMSTLAIGRQWEPPPRQGSDQTHFECSSEERDRRIRHLVQAGNSCWPATTRPARQCGPPGRPVCHVNRIPCSMRSADYAIECMAAVPAAIQGCLQDGGVWRVLIASTVRYDGAPQRAAGHLVDVSTGFECQLSGCLHCASSLRATTLVAANIQATVPWEHVWSRARSTKEPSGDSTICTVDPV